MISRENASISGIGWSGRLNDFIEDAYLMLHPQ
jgi:hypothetical protein